MKTVTEEAFGDQQENTHGQRSLEKSQCLSLKTALADIMCP